MKKRHLSKYGGFEFDISDVVSIKVQDEEINDGLNRSIANMTLEQVGDEELRIGLGFEIPSQVS